MQTLRKKGSPCKYRNDPGRFFGEGVAFKAKLIGILEVGEARGDRMCQEALQDLKMAIRAAGEHKQRISIHVTIDGLRLRDEKTGDSLYHHPVHKISFIAQDMTDSRAFGYIFGSPDSGHRFFGIKTDKAASQVVLAMRDLFQVVFELKKKEIELARHAIQTKTVLGSGGSNISSGHHVAEKTKEQKMSFLNLMDETSFMAGASGGAGGAGGGSGNNGQMGDLVDLEQELSSIQRGITQMEKMTPSEQGPSNSAHKTQDNDDPFGDSFATAAAGASCSSNTTQFNILPPPESSKGASSRQHAKNQQKQQMQIDRKENDWSPPLLPPPGSARSGPRQQPAPDLDRPSTNSPNPNTPSNWLSDDQAMNSLFDHNHSQLDDMEREFGGRSSAGLMQQCKDDSGKFADAFIDLDPLGTGKNRPYVDKKFFFQDVKNPPKKVLKELSSSDVNFMATFQGGQEGVVNELNSSGESQSHRQRKTSSEEEQQQHRYSEQTMFNNSSSGRDSVPQQQQLNYFEPFEDPFEMVPPPPPAKAEHNHPPAQREQHRPSVNHNSSLSVPLKVILPPETNRTSSRGSTPRNRSPNLVRDRGGENSSSRKSSYDSTRRVRQSPIDYHSGFDAPEPPPRPETSNYADPPPLPPKKSFNDVTPRTSNRPSLSSFKMTMSPREGPYSGGKSDSEAPPLPLPSRKVAHSESKYPGPERPHRQEEDGYMVPTDSSIVPALAPPPKASGTTKRGQKRISGAREASAQPQHATTSHASAGPGEGPEAITEITLSQLLQLSMDELAAKLNVSVQKLSTMTIVELTRYLSEFLTKENDEKKVDSSPPRAPLRDMQKTEQNVFKVSFDDDKDATFVAVFDDNFGEEMNEFVADFDNANIQLATTAEAKQTEQQQQRPTNADRYAVFREIFDEQLNSDQVPDLLSADDVVEQVDESVSLDADDVFVEVVPPNPPRLPVKIDTSITATISQAKDRYAALRDIVLVENLFEASPARGFCDEDDESFDPADNVQGELMDMMMDAEPSAMIHMEGEEEEDNFASDNFASDNFGDFDATSAAMDEEDKTITSPTHVNVESPEQQDISRTSEYEIKDKSVTPTFVSARDDLEIDELMNLAVSNLSLNNINSLSPQTTQLQLKNASTSPIMRGQQGSPLPLITGGLGGGGMAPKANVIDTSTSPIIMSKMLSPVAFNRSSPHPASPSLVAPITVVTPPITIEEEGEAEAGPLAACDDEEKEGTALELITDDNGESPVATNDVTKKAARSEEKWTAFEEPAEKPRPIKSHTIEDPHNVVESPCSSDDKDELKVLGSRKWPKGHTSSSSRDVSPRDASPWDDEFGEGNGVVAGRRRVSPGVASDRQGHYMRHGRRMDSCDDDYEYENEYEAASVMSRDGSCSGRRSQGGGGGGGGGGSRERGDSEQWHYNKYGDRGNWPPGHREAMKLRSGRSYEKRKFYSSHGRKTYDYGDSGETGGLPFDIGAPVGTRSGGGGGGGSRDRIKRGEYYGSSRDRRSFDRESNDSYDSGSGGGGGGGGAPIRKPRRDYRNEYYGSIELMPDEYDLDVNKKRYASLEKGHKSSSGNVRRSSSRRSNSDAYDDHDESEEGECKSSSHYQRPYAVAEGTKSLQRGGNRQMQLPPSGGGKGRKSASAAGGGSSPWDSKPSPIYNTKISWSARPSSASEAAGGVGGGSVDRHRYYSTQALTVGCSDTEKERRQRLKGRSATSSSTVQLSSGPQSAQNVGRRYGNEFTFEDEEGGVVGYHPAKGVMRKSARREGASKYGDEMNDTGGGMMRGSSRKLNMSPMDQQQNYPHPRYERTNSRPQPLEGRFYHHQRHDDGYGRDGGAGGGDVDVEEEEDVEEQGFESDFIASSPVKSAGSMKSRPMFRFSTDYSNNNSPGIDSSPSALSSAGGQNGSQPRLRFNEKVKVTNYLEDKSDSLESPPGRDHFEDDFSAEVGDQWDESFPPPITGHRKQLTTKDKDIRKSESVNIFAKKSDDPFEDDDFFKSSAEDLNNSRVPPTAPGAENNFNWNHNFAKFEDNNIM